MKKTFLLAMTMIFATSTFAATPEGDEYNTFPWDFPASQTIEANPGDWALTCSSSYVRNVEKKKDLKKSILIYYAEKVDNVYKDSVTFKNYGQKTTVPSSLVIPIPAGQKAKKGDIVLTWWQSGSGKSRAIVVDDANPAEPKVCYLDFDWRGDGTGIAEKRQDVLKPNSFIVLKKEGEWKPGHQVALNNGEYQTGSILAVTKDKVLVHWFADNIDAVKRSDCVLVPYNEKIKVGDSVYAYWLGRYKPGYKVLEIDKEHGRYKCEDSSKTVKYFSFYEVTKMFK